MTELVNKVCMQVKSGSTEGGVGLPLTFTTSDPAGTQIYHALLVNDVCPVSVLLGQSLSNIIKYQLVLPHICNILTLAL